MWPSVRPDGSPRLRPQCPRNCLNEHHILFRRARLSRNYYYFSVRRSIRFREEHAGQPSRKFVPPTEREISKMIMKYIHHFVMRSSFRYSSGTRLTPDCSDLQRTHPELRTDARAALRLPAARPGRAGGPGKRKLKGILQH